jgi:protein-S-isoprenylcysteine O-methyltransferase Ste14
MDTLHLLLLLSAIFCLGSFIYGAQCFFVKPEKKNIGLVMIYVCNAIFGGMHWLAIGFLYTFNPIAYTVGLVLYGCAVSLFWWAISVNRKKPLTFAFTNDKPEHLIATGPYRYVRHPFYVSYLIAWIAGAVSISQYWLLIAFCVTFVLYLDAALREERKFSSSDLSTQYAQYQSQVGMFLPLFGRRQ